MRPSLPLAETVRSAPHASARPAHLPNLHRRCAWPRFKGAVAKDVVSRVWHKVKTDWEAWTRRDLADEDIVRLMLDGSVVRVRLDRKATNISLLVVLGIRRDGQKVLLAVRNMGGESEAAWRGYWMTSLRAACEPRNF